MAYIDKEALLQDISETVLFSVRGGVKTPTQEMRGANKVIDRIKSAPTADVVEVRHGEWNIISEVYRMIDDVDEELFVECPFCQRRYHVPYSFDDKEIIEYAREEYPYCHCGAKMDGKGEINAK